jgi:hypothetical protein
VFLKEAKHFYREEAKTAKRQKGRSRSICHGMTRKNTEKTEAETRKKEQAEAFATD